MCVSTRFYIFIKINLMIGKRMSQVHTRRRWLSEILRALIMFCSVPIFVLCMVVPDDDLKIEILYWFCFFGSLRKNIKVLSAKLRINKSV